MSSSSKTHKRIIKGESTQIRRIEKIIETEFMSSTSGGITCTKNERKLLPFSLKLGGLGIPKFEDSYQVEYKISENFTE